MQTSCQWGQFSLILGYRSWCMRLVSALWHSHLVCPGSYSRAGLAALLWWRVSLTLQVLPLWLDSHCLKTQLLQCGRLPLVCLSQNLCDFFFFLLQCVHVRVYVCVCAHFLGPHQPTPHSTHTVPLWDDFSQRPSILCNWLAGQLLSW